jgi:cation diffusion facilitator family transporter
MPVTPKRLSRFKPRQFEIWSKKLSNTIIWSVALAFGKIGAGLISGAVSITSDGIHNLADMVRLSLVHHFSGKKESKDVHVILHCVFALLYLMAAVTILRFGFKRLFEPEIYNATLFTFLAAVSLTFNFLIARVLSSERQEVPGHREAYQTMLSNVVSALFVVLVSAVAHVNGWLMVDTFLTLAFGLLLILEAANALKHLVVGLMDKPEDETDIVHIATVLCSHPYVTEAHSIRKGFSYNGQKQISAVLVLDRNHFERVTEIRSDLEQKLSSEFGIGSVHLAYELTSKTTHSWLEKTIFDESVVN